MCKCILLDDFGMEKEEISASEFAALKSDVHYQGRDIAEIKESTKTIADAIVSLSVSQAAITAHVEQNSKLEPRLKVVEDKIQSTNVKIATATGGATAIGLLIGYLAKLKGLLG